MTIEILELEHDRQLYKKLRSHLTLDERIALLDFQGDYKRYRETLLRLSRKYKIHIPKV